MTAWPASTDDAELTTTVAPSSDNRRAVSSPIPADEPVTIATRPENSGSLMTENVVRTSGMAVIDHLVLAVPDLDRAMDDVAREYGVRPMVGGRHEGLGTHNALVSFGSSYLELIAPDPTQPDPDGPRPFGVDGIERSTLVAWAVRPDATAGESLEALIAACRRVGRDAIVEAAESLWFDFDHLLAGEEAGA